MLANTCKSTVRALTRQPLLQLTRSNVRATSHSLPVPGARSSGAFAKAGLASPTPRHATELSSLRHMTAIRTMATGNSAAAGQEVATLGGGCFWCLEACYQQLKGVSKVVSGYAGGHVPNPTYEQVCGKKTGHAEVVQVTYDPSIITYDDVLEAFFVMHDPTTKDRQGNDVGPQYRSVIMYHDDAQKAAAEAFIKKVEADQRWGSAPVVTELMPLPEFYPAEQYHQNYYNDNPRQGYCQFVVAPKVAKVRKELFEKLRA